MNGLLENQVSDAKQCGHQDGKVTVPHEEMLAKINAVRYAFLGKLTIKCLIKVLFTVRI